MNISQGLFSPINLECAKRRVIAVLIPKDNGYPPHYIGRNTCLSPQDVCPREEEEDYTKCKTICKQTGLSEENVLRYAGSRAKGATVVVVGHYHCCDQCKDLMSKAGVAEVIILEK